MEEKEPIKMRLSTAILSIIILVLIGGIVYFVIQNNNLQSAKQRSESEVMQLQSKVAEFEKTINEVRNTVSNVSTNTVDDTEKSSMNTASTSDTTDKYEEITSDNQLEKDEILRITDVEKNNGKYILKGVIFRPYTLTKSEYNEIIANGKMDYYEIDAENYKEGEELKSKKKTYIVKKNPNSAYALYETKNDEYPTYIFHGPVTEKDDNYGNYIYLRKDVYYLQNLSECWTEWKLTDDYRKIVLDGDTACYVEENDLEESENLNVSEYFKDFKSSEPEKGDHHPLAYTFDFKNGKCSAVIQRITGH